MERLSRRFDERLGPTGRRFMYVKMLSQPRADDALQQPGRSALGGPRAPGWAGRSPCASSDTRSASGPGMEVEDEAAVWSELDFVAELLAGWAPASLRRALQRGGPDLRGAVRVGGGAARVRRPATAARAAAARDGRVRRTAFETTRPGATRSRCSRSTGARSLPEGRTSSSRLLVHFHGRPVWRARR